MKSSIFTLKTCICVSILFLSIPCIHENAFGQTTTWDGSTSTDWTTAANWDNGIPDMNTDAIIPASGVTQYPIVTVHPCEVSNLTIESSASVNITMNGSVHIYGDLANSGNLTIDHNRSYGMIVDGNVVNDGTFDNTTSLGYVTATFSIAGDLTNNGTFTCVEHLVFNGTSTQSIDGTVTPVFQGIVVDNTSGIQLSNDISITGKITFQNGKLFLADNHLMMDVACTVTGEDENSYVVVDGTGGITYTNVGSHAYYPLGSATSFSPLTLYNSGTSDNFTVRVSDEILEDGTSGPAITNSAINKTWFIEEGTPGGSIVSLTFEWSSSMELPLFDRDACAITHHNGTTWETLGTLNPADASENPGTEYRRQVWGVTTFSPFGVGSGGSVLPVVLIRFEAQTREKGIHIEWETAGELNNDFFEVQHAADGITFAKLGVIEGQGTIEHNHVYEYVHAIPHPGMQYYRLLQVDFDGTYAYSNIITAHAGDVNNTALCLLYPNPTAHTVSVKIHHNGHFPFRIVDQLGQNVHTGYLKGGTENNILTQSWNRGLYTLIANVEGTVVKRKILIE